MNIKIIKFEINKYKSFLRIVGGGDGEREMRLVGLFLKMFLFSHFSDFIYLIILICI